MSIEIKYSEKAAKQLRKISKGDKQSAKMIVESIGEYAENPAGNLDIKILKGQYGQFKRLRVGNYRVIFDNDGNVMLIYEIKHRQEAYK